MIEKEGRHECMVCNKAFSCGKAVGGHMRAHKLEKQGRIRTRRRSSNCGSHVDDTTCELCGRVFPSMKSLFGHMRCHPERNWRGMNSPSTEVEEVDDLVSAAVEGLLMLARGGEDVNEEKDEYVDGDSNG